MLVGHSIGGDYAMTYAARYPEQVAGMVLLDATNPYRATAAATRPTPVRPAPSRVLPSVARLGIGRLLPTSTWSAPARAGREARSQAFASSPRRWAQHRGRNRHHARAVRPGPGADHSRAARRWWSSPPPGTTADDRGWTDAQDRMAALSTNSSHRVADVDARRPAGRGARRRQSAHAIDDVVQAVRTGAPLPPN